MNFKGVNIITKISVAVCLIIINHLWVFADNVTTTIGFKSTYSSGISDTNIVYKPYCKIGYEVNFFKIETTGTYTINQQITNGLGNFTEINTGQGQVKALLSMGDIIDIGAGYSLARGQNSYNSNMYTINGSLYVGDVTLDLDYSNENKKYEYISEMNITNNTFTGLLSYDASDSIGFEIEYNYMSNNFSNLDYTYYKNSGRLGISIYSNTSMYMIGGSIGKDSGDYMIYGFDLAISKKIYNMVKFMILYAFDYYNISNVTTTTTTSGGGHGGNNTNNTVKYKGGTPYMKSDLLGKSFASHSLSATISFSF